MKVIIIGATGTIGKYVSNALRRQHEVINVSYSRGDYKINIEDENSIINFFKEIGSFDALVATTGKVYFGELHDMSSEKWQIGLNNKLMGQVNLVSHGLKYINDGGSFTLTSGILNKDPVKSGSSAALVNGALEGFVIGSAIEMTRNIRINIVSPTIVSESIEKYKEYFHGFRSISADEVAQCYVKSIEGRQTGQIYKAGW